MIINYTLENWMSFREATSFSMVAGREKQHSQRLAVLERYKTKILPITAIYGGNASGKSNFFKSLAFMVDFIVQGRKPGEMTGVEPFLLERKYREQPTSFRLEILIDDKIYEYGFSVTAEKVTEEKLIEIGFSNEVLLYHRQGGIILFGKQLEPEKDFLNFVFRSTRENQLFLTSSVFQNSDCFSKIYSWFKEELVLISPNSRYQPTERFMDESGPLAVEMNEILPGMDTGIGRICGESVSADNDILPQGLKDILQHELPEGKTQNVNVRNDRFVVTKQEGKLKVQRLVAYHKTREGEVRFELRQESDGSQRLLDLLPAFLVLLRNNSRKVCVIDELDRSLHTLLTRQLLMDYLDNYSTAGRCQLLFTTHDALLMDQDIFRRDEICVAERDREGSSRLFALSEYKNIRKDKDVRKSYLQGRLGGVPRLLLKGRISSDEGECR